MCDRVLHMKDEIGKWTLDSMDCLFVQRESLVPVVCCCGKTKSIDKY